MPTLVECVCEGMVWRMRVHNAKFRVINGEFRRARLAPPYIWDDFPVREKYSLRSTLLISQGFVICFIPYLGKYVVRDCEGESEILRSEGRVVLKVLGSYSSQYKAAQSLREKKWGEAKLYEIEGSLEYPYKMRLRETKEITKDVLGDDMMVIIQE